MREIKFRAWDTNNKKWANPESFFVSSKGDFCWGDEGGWPYKEDDFILSQFTGLKDAKGREIYEGDILKQKYPGVWAVMYEYGRFQLVRSNDKCRYYFRRTACTCRRQPMGIIGNIYENPELLEAK